VTSGGFESDTGDWTPKTLLDPKSGKTTPCQVTPIILRGVASPPENFTRGCIPDFSPHILNPRFVLSGGNSEERKKAADLLRRAVRRPPPPRSGHLRPLL